MVYWFVGREKVFLYKVRKLKMFCLLLVVLLILVFYKVRWWKRKWLNRNGLVLCCFVKSWIFLEIVKCFIFVGWCILIKSCCLLIVYGFCCCVILILMRFMLKEVLFISYFRSVLICEWLVIKRLLIFLLLFVCR